MRARVAVLASGGGSNLEAIVTHFATLGAAAPGAVVLVASDRPKAFALERARAHGIEALALSAEDREHGLLKLVEARGITHVALAGYLRFVPREVTHRFAGRVVNIHPSLLPAFGGRGMYGARVHEAVIAAKAKVSGATVHFVDEEYDRGPIIAQWPVPVYATDVATDLAARVLAVEHALYPPVVAALAAGRVGLDALGRVVGYQRPLDLNHALSSDGPPSSFSH